MQNLHWVFWDRRCNINALSGLKISWRYASTRILMWLAATHQLQNTNLESIAMHMRTPQIGLHCNIANTSSGEVITKAYPKISLLLNREWSRQNPFVCLLTLPNPTFPTPASRTALQQVYERNLVCSTCSTRQTGFQLSFWSILMCFTSNRAATVRIRRHLSQKAAQVIWCL